jgi:hypothetical protein
MWSRRYVTVADIPLRSAGMDRLGIDTSVPNSARMYDYWLGGKDNFAADREAAELSARAVPQLPWLARQNRAFLGRAVRFCADAGVTQFLDIGSGLPTMENVHQVARPGSRVVYVDIDPVVVNHARALLSAPGIAAVRGDVRHPDEILQATDVRELIDFGKPVAILIVSVLHFIPDEDDPFGAVARLRAAMAPGSYLVIAHVKIEPADGDPAESETARELGAAGRGLVTGPPRGRGDIARFFGDLGLVDPGLTDVWNWRPDTEPVANASEFMTVLGGVARKP